MAVPYLLSGIFPKFWFRRRKRNRFLPKRVSLAVMFSVFGSGSCEEVHYCGKWFLRQWRYGVFSEEVWSSSGRKKQVDFSQRLGKTSRFFFLVVFKSRSAFSKWQRETTLWVFLPDVSKLFTVVSDQAFSILPMIFLSCPSWRRYCRGLRRLHELFLLPGKDQGTITVTKF